MASRVPRQHRRSRVDSDVPERLRETRTWYLVAAAPAFTLVAAVVFFLSIGLAGLLPGAAGIIVSGVLALLGIAGLVAFGALPVGLRMDADLLSEVPTDWTPDADDLVRRGGAAAGTYLATLVVASLVWDPITGVFLALLVGGAAASYVAGGYLRERRSRVGLA